MSQLPITCEVTVSKAASPRKLASPRPCSGDGRANMTLSQPSPCLLCVCLVVQRRLSASLKAAYGEEAWQYMPQSYTVTAEMAEWKAWLDQQAAAGADPGPWMLKTAQHLGKGLCLLPGAAAYHAATQPRYGAFSV